MNVYDFALLLALDESINQQTIWHEPDWDSGESVGLTGCPIEDARRSPRLVSIFNYGFLLPKPRPIKHTISGFWRGPRHVAGGTKKYPCEIPYQGLYIFIDVSHSTEIEAAEWKLVSNAHLGEMLTEEARTTAFEMWLTARKWAGAKPAKFEHEMRLTQAMCRREWEEV